MAARKVRDLYDLKGRVAVITGGGGLLGPMHAAAIAESGGVPVLVDIDEARATDKAAQVRAATGADVGAVRVDVTDPADVARLAQAVEQRWGPVHILINNAANDPKVTDGDEQLLTRLENLPLERWRRDFDVGVTGALLCSQVMGGAMARRGAGVILNVSSDLGIVAPDQRLYRKEGVAEERQPVKPVTYSVVKHAVIGLTRYLATYWAHRGVRANAIAPGGVFADQPAPFLHEVTQRIPMGRLANVDDYKGAVAFLCSDASSYMTGAVVVIDGGRSVW